MQRWDDLTPAEQQRIIDASRRVEEAERKLNELMPQYVAQVAELLAKVERYGADQWRRGNAGKEPQEFDEWKREQE